MKAEQKIWSLAAGWQTESDHQLGEKAQLVLIFGGADYLKDRKRIEEIKHFYPKAHLVGCSTAGEICGTHVADDTIVLTAVQFEHTTIKVTNIKLKSIENSFMAGERLIAAMGKQGLAHVIVLSEGIHVNGSELVKGMASQLSQKVSVTGGLSADGDRFKKTFVICDQEAEEDTIAAIGLYGDHIKVNFSAMGGWEPFGPERMVTRSESNVLYELDGQSALALYKEYLGEHAQKLPSAALLFPLSLQTADRKGWVVRTILGINEEDQSMTFAGDIAEGSFVRLMSANYDNLIDGAIGAAKASYKSNGKPGPDLAILMSCVGRKLLLKQRVEEEIEGVRDVFGDQTVLTGFYTYGEIAPFRANTPCVLHNQTMTITTLSEY